MKNRNWLIEIGTISVLITVLIVALFSSDMLSSADSSSPEVSEPQEENNTQEEKQQKDSQTGSSSVEEEPFTIAFAGDTMFDWDLRPILNEKGYDYPFEYVKKDLQRADYTVANLETSVTELTEKKANQLFWIRSDIRGVEALKNSGVDMVNLANNHVLDYGEEGLIDTIESVEKYDMEYIGAGRSEQEAYKAKVVEINNQKVAFLSFSRFYPSHTWAAEGNEPGVTNGYNLDLVIQKIKEQQEKVDTDYLVVNFHWGIEKTNTPAQYQRDYVKRIVEETETDAIVGAHPHWVQGFEFYQGVPVAYSLGNFLFPDYVSGHAAETGVYNLTFDDGDITADFIPYEIKNNQILPLEGEQKQAMYQYLDEISINASVDEQGRIRKEE